MSTPSPRAVLYAALAANCLVAVTKIAAAAWTGSSAMTSEAVHSVVDTLNEILLLYGVRRADRRPDIDHPLGYGRELYFWSFIVALLVFALGAVAAIFEGIDHILHPEPVQDRIVIYGVLAVAFAVDGASWLVALQRFRRTKRDLGFYEALRRSKDPPSFIVLLEDSIALLGIGVAAAGTFAAAAFHEPILDGVASIVIGLLLAATALLIARESKSLLIGERADQALSHSILGIVAGENGVSGANGLLSVQLAPDQVLVALSVEFDDEMRSSQIEDQVIAVEQKIRAAHPEVVALFIKPQTAKGFAAARRARFGDTP
ncbi:cation diffusion facilitator family transporter [Bosea sp. 685]|uniref:cation diffusion facilitator family transporter n=1 Tax=Bosea sp. 685 TaxID=3080057 RepID=UPI002893501A|nr:cation diffusion facilitator family transporter [Bosea sp. 685]WNJ93937.1 cation diffusion facilitator family transporter [Bosea sp. 685]